MKITFSHSGKYTGDSFSIDEVIDSLIAQKAILTTAAQFLAEIDPNFSLDDVKIIVNRIETNTLSWDILIELYGKYQENIETGVIGGLEEIFETDIPKEYEALVTLAALAVTYIVARYAYDRVFRSGGKSSPSIHISGEGNTIIQNIAKIVNQSPEAVERALERTVPPTKRRTLIGKVADFMRPSRKAPGEKIEIDRAPDISADALKEFPNDAELRAVADSANIDVDAASIEIRATDRDKSKMGWSAVIQGDERFPKRLPMDLYPTIDSENLAEHHFVKADLIVECERRADGSLKPKRIHLLSYDVGP